MGYLKGSTKIHCEISSQCVFILFKKKMLFSVPIDILHLFFILKIQAYVQIFSSIFQGQSNKHSFDKKGSYANVLLCVTIALCGRLFHPVCLFIFENFSALCNYYILWDYQIVQSRHEKHCQMLERLFVVFHHSRNIPCSAMKKDLP